MSTCMSILLLLSCIQGLYGIPSNLEFLSNFQREGKSALQSSSNEFAYEVRLARDSSYADNENFKFDDVMYNRGGAYNKGSGIFTAPVSGTYLLWAHIMRNDKLWMTVYIQSSRRSTLLKGYITAGSNIHGVASITGVAYLTKGEHVWVTKVGYRTTSLRGDYFSSYGGALL